MGWLSQLSTGDAINLALLALTSVVSGFGVYQFFATTRFSRAQTAKSIHSEYVQMAMNNPIFANPALSNFDFHELTINGSRELFEQYEWFVSFMVLSFEEMFFLSKDPTWKNAIQSNLVMHRDYFTSAHFRASGYIDNVDPVIRKMISAL